VGGSVAGRSSWSKINLQRGIYIHYRKTVMLDYPIYFEFLDD